jgi:RecB family endonuclease NucS
VVFDKESSAKRLIKRIVRMQIILGTHCSILVDAFIKTVLNSAARYVFFKMSGFVALN